MTLRLLIASLALFLVACPGSEADSPGDAGPRERDAAVPAHDATTDAAESTGARPASTKTTANAAAVPASDAPLGSKPGEAPANFDLPVLSGGSSDRLSLKDLRGKVILMTYWASWCGPCRMEVPALEKHWKSLRDTDAVVVGISIDDNEAAANSFLSMFPVTYPMALDVGGRTVADSWGVSSIPATIVIDKQGVVRKRHLGYSPTMLANTVKLVRELEQE
ncbi:MAG: TlpA family protein disulfide reductase [Deltaproteobacteria bacterium]|nr:TlpA family protein disulfide reductase [Deltaproteobacteria bacterium]